MIEPYYYFLELRIDTAAEKIEEYKPQVNRFALLLLEYVIPVGKM